MLAVINVALRRRIGGVGRARQQRAYLYASVFFSSIPEKANALRKRRSKRIKRDFAKIEANSFAPTPSQLVQSTRLFAKQTVVRALLFL